MPHTIFDLSYQLDDIHTAAKAFWQIAKNHRIIAFSGQLGAGKTTFIHALCEELGVPDNVSSPTFALINEYHFTEGLTGRERKIYHMDWYRLKSTEEAIGAGMEDALSDEDAYCFIEWPEKAEELLPASQLRVSIESISETGRTMRAALI
jgi:tRNA threonylcarbamoyladenosine biosynthesis protein TsaE